MAEVSPVDPARSYVIVQGRLVEGNEVLVTIERSPQAKGFGPWALVIDESPNTPPSRGVGPAPVDTALSALAA